MPASAARVALQIVFFALFPTLGVSGVQRLTVSPDRGSSVFIVNAVRGSACAVCAQQGGGARQCGASVRLSDAGTAALEFNCSATARPQDVFSVEILRDIKCSTKLCDGIVLIESPGSLPLSDFHRTFTWNLTASSSSSSPSSSSSSSSPSSSSPSSSSSSSSSVPAAFRIDFTKTGLGQIEPGASCRDKHTYSLEAWPPQRGGGGPGGPPPEPVAVGTFCREGAVRGAQVQNQARFSVRVPAGQKLQAALFPVSVGEKIKSLARIQVVLSDGPSSSSSSESELLSPNYPAPGLPDDTTVEWDVQLAAEHSAAVRLVDHTTPRCRESSSSGGRRGAAAMEYVVATGDGGGRGGGAPLPPAVVLELAARSRPVRIRGNFSLTLSNCAVDRSGAADAPGLAVRFTVSARRSASPVQCSVDLTKKKGVSLNVEKTTADSACEMWMDSVPQGKISVPAGTRAQLTFQDCLPEDLLVVARQIMECADLRGCSGPFALTVPDLRGCPPAPLSSVTWTLRPPVRGTVELWPPAGGLTQALPGQRCNDSSSVLQISEDDGTSVGQFCPQGPQGPVQKMQIHSGVSVGASRAPGRELVASQALLNARFNKEIFERYIFHVSPKKGGTAPTLLATPGWPAGMKPYATVAWIVAVPAGMEARVRFANATRPKCGDRHSVVGVRALSSPEEVYTRREDEPADDVVRVYETFYLNMSNCMPEDGRFSVLSHITLQRDRNVILSVVLSVVAILCVLTIAVLAVVCVVIRNKKKQLSRHQVSIYNPNGASFLPGHGHGAGAGGGGGFPKSREDNESHVYASIEDDLVYTHLLRKGEDDEAEVYGELADTYRPWAAAAGPADQQQQQPGPSGAGANVGVYQAYRAAAHKSQQAPPLPNRPASHGGPPMVDNEIYGGGAEPELHGEADGSSSHHSEEEAGAAARGPRLDPEGGD